MKFVLGCIFIALSVSCSTTGQIIDPIKQLASLKPGVTSKVDVIHVMGSPDGNEQLFGQDRLLYGVRKSHSITVPQIIVAIDPTSQKVIWASYVNFYQKLSLELIKQLYPTGKFEQELIDLKKFRDYIPTEKSFSDRDLGVYYTVRKNNDVASISWSAPKMSSNQKAENKITSKNE